MQEFFAQQSLKILPQAPFGDAVNQFVSKDDKHAVEMFLIDSLSTQVKGLLQLDDEKITEGLDAHIEDFRKVMEKSFVSGQQKQAQRKRRFKEKPDGWDSDLDGHWTAQPQAIEEAPPSPEPRRRGQPTSGVTFSDDDDDMLDEEAPTAKAPAKRAPASRATKKAAPAKKAAAPAKKAAAPKKAPASSRGRRKVNPFQDSEEEESDVIMDDDDEEEPAPPPRAAAAKPTRETRTRNSRTRQTTLNFSQSQKPAKAPQKAIEMSDDEISEDDAFESMPATRSRRR